MSERDYLISKAFRLPGAAKRAAKGKLVSRPTASQGDDIFGAHHRAPISASDDIFAPRRVASPPKQKFTTFEQDRAAKHLRNERVASARAKSHAEMIARRPNIGPSKNMIDPHNYSQRYI